MREKVYRIKSDISGDELTENNAVRVTLVFQDKSKSRLQLDVGEYEIRELIDKAPAPRARRRGRS